MACSSLITSGYTLNCRNSTGGLSYICIGSYNGTDTLYTIDPTTKVIGTVSFVGATISFYKFEQELETASFVQSGQFSTENGTSFYEQTLEITLTNMTPALRNTITLLGQGVWRIIVADQNGNFFLMGKNNPVRVSASNPQSGKAFGDLSGATITFIGKEPEPAHFLSASAAAALII